MSRGSNKNVFKPPQSRKPMSAKQHILDSIAAIARGLGRAPSRSEFVSLAGITDYHVLQCFPSWNDAVRAAGLHPYTLNVRLEDSELLKDWGEIVRTNRAMPARRAYRRLGKYDPRTLERRFGPWSSLPEVFLNFSKDNPEWADVVALLPVPVLKQEHGSNNAPASPILPKKTRHMPLRDRATYGNPTHFRGLRHEPVNEQGVVLLFGMLAKELGYVIEAVQTGFPDCEAKRQIGPERWQLVRIEFEFESRNFRDHGHPASGCDVIVCWRHNWDECPGQIEIVELSNVIKSLADSEN
jgi:Homing endonuclease associated repeat